jgi:hypothetical protein
VGLITSSEHVAGAIKATPPAAVTGLSLAGVTLNEWVMIATLIYTVMQIGWFIYSKTKTIRKD